MPTPDQIDRFRLGAFRIGEERQPLGLAVSGGPDSLALLILARLAFPGVEAATVDHGLRPENAEEAEAVAAICKRLGVPHAILSDPDAPISGASRQAQARALRYRLLGEWAAARGLARLATAHHADDQAETMLMRLARGAGVAGLAGIRARREEGPLLIVRPLLRFRRAELQSIVREAGLTAVDDPSNRSDAFDRTRFRRHLSGTALLPAERLAASASHLAEAEEALAWAAEREWRTRARQDGDIVALDATGLPPELRRRLAVRAVSAVRDSGDWRVEMLTTLVLTAIDFGGSVNLAGVLITGGDGPWRFEPEPPRRSR